MRRVTEPFDDTMGARLTDVPVPNKTTDEIDLDWIRAPIASGVSAVDPSIARTSVIHRKLDLRLALEARGLRTFFELWVALKAS